MRSVRLLESGGCISAGHRVCVVVAHIACIDLCGSLLFDFGDERDS